MGDRVLKSVRPHCVAESTATDVPGDKLGCHFTHTLQYPRTQPTLERLNPPLYNCNLINTPSLKPTMTAGAVCLSRFVWTVLSSSPWYHFCPTPALISLCAQVLQFPMKVVVTAHTDLRKHIGLVIPNLTVDCLLTSQSPVEILRSCLNNFFCSKREKVIVMG